MKLLTGLALSLVTVATSACIVKDEAEDLRGIKASMPTGDNVQIALPANANMGAAALGTTADYYRVTRLVTLGLNGGAAWTLLVVNTVVQFPPTAVDGNTYTWGPSSQALDPAEWRLTVTAEDDGTYTWSLDGRSKTMPGAEFEVLASGHAVPGAQPHRGSGDFTLNFDNAEDVNPDENDANGTVDVTYDLEPASGARATLAMHIENTEDDGTGTLAPGVYDYAYAEQPDGAGDFVFDGRHDLADEGTLAERTTVRSRWEATGAGRADARVTDGDLGDLQVTASECWDNHFLEVFYTDSATWQPTAGVETDCGAFQTADLPE